MHPDTEQRRLVAEQGLIRWTFTAQLQLRRVHEAQAVLTEQRGERPSHYGDREREPFLVLFADRHFLLVALANVVRSLALMEALGAPDVQSLEARHAKRIRLLRNIFEHWDEAPADLRSLTQFRAAFPDDDHDQHRWSMDGSADSIGGLALTDVEAAIVEVRAWALSLERSGWVWSDEGGSDSGSP